jgi:hypothetical protein
MRKLRPGVARAWRRVQFYQKVNQAFAKALPSLIGNFYAETPVQRLLRERREWVDRCAMPDFQRETESLGDQGNVHTDGWTG